MISPLREFVLGYIIWWTGQSLFTFPLTCLPGLSHARVILHLGWYHCHHLPPLLETPHPSWLNSKCLHAGSHPWSSSMMWVLLLLGPICHHFLWNEVFCFLMFQPLLGSNLLEERKRKHVCLVSCIFNLLELNIWWALFHRCRAHLGRDSLESPQLMFMLMTKSSLKSIQDGDQPVNSYASHGLKWSGSNI